MPEIGPSGLMSGDGKRSMATWLKQPRPSSTLLLSRRQNFQRARNRPFTAAASRAVGAL
jgi:hypothetical protein